MDPDDAARPDPAARHGTPHREDTMIARLGQRHDPFWDDGRGARRRQLRVRIETRLAFAIAIVACGLTTAAWIQQLLPVIRQFGLG
jgi:hypothetical protein